MTDTLYTKLVQAEVVCRDCGTKYGKYSVGCSSMWEGECDVCGERKPITEVRDWGYLGKGIQEIRGAIKEQSKGVADYMLTVGPDGPEPEASYEQGEITCKFTEEEVSFLNSWLDKVDDLPGPEEVAVWETVSQKIYELYGDYCVKYELSPALKAYYEKYGAYGTESEMEMARWEGFRDAYNTVNKLN